MLSMYFIVVTLKHFVNDLSVNYRLPYHTQTVNFATINCLRCLTMAKTNHIDSTRPAPLSMNELANSLLNIGILIGLGFRL